MMATELEISATLWSIWHGKHFVTPDHPLFVTSSHSLLLDVTSRLTAFSLRLLTPTDPAAIAP